MSGTPDTQTAPGTPQERTPRVEPLWEFPENRLPHFLCAQLTWPVPESESQLVYVYGPPGTGKSHLLQLTCQRFADIMPTGKVLCQTAADFVADFTAAAANRQFARWRRQYLELAVWCVEDLHGLARRERAQQTFQNLLDEHLAQGGLLLLSARSLPAQISGLGSHLLSRLHSATCASLQPLTVESRHAFLERALQRSGLAVPESMLTTLRTRLEETPREILGQLAQLEQGLTRLPTGPRGAAQRWAKAWLDEPGEEAPRLNPHLIAKAVAKEFGVPLAELRGAGRAQRFVVPRHCAMFLVRSLTTVPLQAIGDYFGGRDHATVLHALQNWETRLIDHPELQPQLTRIRESLGVP